MTQEISKEEIGKGKELKIANYNIYFKNNFNRLVMNVRNKFSLLAKCTYIYDVTDISQAIAAESTALRIAGSQTRTGNFWFPSASRQALSYASFKIRPFCTCTGS